MLQAGRSRLLLPFSGFFLTAMLLITQTASSQEQDTPEHSEDLHGFSWRGIECENYKGTIHVSASDGNQVVVDVQKRFEGDDSDQNGGWKT